MPLAHLQERKIPHLWEAKPGKSTYSEMRAYPSSSTHRSRGGPRRYRPLHAAQDALGCPRTGGPRRPGSGDRPHEAKAHMFCPAPVPGRPLRPPASSVSVAIPSHALRHARIRRSDVSGASVGCGGTVLPLCLLFMDDSFQTPRRYLAGRSARNASHSRSVVSTPSIWSSQIRRFRSSCRRVGTRLLGRTPRPPA